VVPGLVRDLVCRDEAHLLRREATVEQRVPEEDRPAGSDAECVRVGSRRLIVDVFDPDREIAGAFAAFEVIDRRSESRGRRLRTKPEDVRQPDLQHQSEREDEGAAHDPPPLREALRNQQQHTEQHEALKGRPQQREPRLECDQLPWLDGEAVPPVPPSRQVEEGQ
jgi:hypothetical protein